MSYYDIDAILTDAEKIPCTFELDLPELGYLDNAPTRPLKAGTKLGLPLWLSEMLALANTGASSQQQQQQQQQHHDPSQPGPASSFVTLSLPAALGNDVVSALKADARAVPLRDQSAHFYALATRMLELFDERELGAVLRRAWVARAAELALHARKAGEEAGAGGGGEHRDIGGAGASSGTGAGVGATGRSHGGKSGAGGPGAGKSNLGVGAAGEEFLRGLDDWERQLLRCAHDGTRAAKEWMDGVKRR